MSIPFKMRDDGLNIAFNQIQPEQTITNENVKSLLHATKDDNQINRVEKSDLEWLLYLHEDKFSPEAKTSLSNALGIPLNSTTTPTVYIKDTKLQTTLTEISKEEADQILNATKDFQGLNENEKKDLEFRYQRLNGVMEHSGRLGMTKAFGLAPPLQSVSNLWGRYIDITDLSEFNNTLQRNLEQAKQALLEHPSLTKQQKAERLLSFFEPYGRRFYILSENVDAETAERERKDVIKTLQSFGFSERILENDDQEDMILADELMRGSDSTKFSLLAKRKTWATTYWPMAGKLSKPEGDPKLHLWANDGALDKFEQLLTSRGFPSEVQVLKTERQPALNWPIRKKDTRRFILTSELDEQNAEITTGIDFTRSGTLEEGIDVTLDGITFTTQDIQSLLTIIAQPSRKQ